MKLRHVRLSAVRLLAAIFVGLMVMGVQSAAAATLVVDDDAMASTTDCNALTATYMTISAAEAAASPGDTIKVCPGVYTGVFIDVDDLTVLGAQAGVDARTRAFVAANESIIHDACGPVQIGADRVVLNGFTVQGSSISDPCFIAGIWSNPGFSGNDGGYQILNNIVQNNIFGIFLNSNCVNPTLVQFNLIQNNNNPGPGSGNGIESELGLCNTDIDRNKFSGHTNSSILMVGIQTKIAISNNELVGGAPERFVLATTTMSSITGNVSIGSTAMNGTVRLFGGNSNVAIDSNILFNGVRGIRVDDPFAIGSNSGITAHLNCIDGNTVAGMQVDSGGHSGTLHAQNNWWGSPNGPTTPSNPGGTGDALIDPDGVVDFTPFLKSCPTGAAAPSQATGGGQIAVTGGRGSFGFVAKQSQSGHLNYTNHASGAHLNCTVTLVTFLSTTAADFSGTCSSNSSAATFSAHVEDNDKTTDKFIITYNAMTEGGTITRGQINIK
jgi:hypothetical protein